MADVKFEVTRFTLSTASAGNTQDVTLSGFGTPKAAIFIFSNGQVDGTPATDMRAGFGFTDGTRQYAIGLYDKDTLTRTGSSRGQTDDAVIQLVGIDGSSATLLTKFGFNQWITDGVRLDIDVPAIDGRIVTVIFIGGTDVSNAYVNFKDDLGIWASAVDITDPGFEPDLVFIAGIGSSDAPTIGATHAIASFGVAHNDGSDAQRGVFFSSQNAATTANNTSYISNQSAAAQAYNGSLTWRGTVGAFDSSGFSITPNSNARDDIVGYLALKFTNSPDISLFDMEWPTSGNYAETAPGFTPTFGMIMGVQGPTARNTVTTAGTYSVSVAAFDAASIETHSATSENSVSTTNANSLSSNQLRILDVAGSADLVLASSYAFDSDGWDFTLSTNPGAAVLGWGLAIGAGASTTVGAPSPLQQLSNQFSTIAASRLNGVLQ